MLWLCNSDGREYLKMGTSEEFCWDLYEHEFYGDYYAMTGLREIGMQFFLLMLKIWTSLTISENLQLSKYRYMFHIFMHSSDWCIGLLRLENICTLNVYKMYFFIRLLDVYISSRLYVWKTSTSYMPDLDV